ncbi:MAG: YjbQ family protein [Thermoprotei archaeon]|nr:MAG: YjbQ family protein [Thermoprotei archaeon]
MCECKVYSEEFYVSTKNRFEVVNISSKVEEVVRKSGISNGIALVFLPHATAALIANEYEPRIVSDYIEWVKKNIPPDAPWRHNEIDNNAHAHIASAIIESSRIFPVINGRLVRGTWQEIMLLELDGPRNRRVVVQVLGC